MALDPPKVETLAFNSFFFNAPSWQWQPVTYGAAAIHDPGPPITLEDASTGAKPSLMRQKTLAGTGK